MGRAKRRRQPAAPAPSGSESPEARFAGAAAELRRGAKAAPEQPFRGLTRGEAGPPLPVQSPELGVGVEQGTPDTALPRSSEAPEGVSGTIEGVVQGEVARARVRDLFWLLALLMATLLGVWGIIDNQVDSVRQDLRDGVNSIRGELHREVDRVERAQQEQDARIRNIESVGSRARP